MSLKGLGVIAPADVPRRPLAGLAMVVFASLGGMLQGYDTGTINGILQMHDWLRTFGDSIVTGGQADPSDFAIATSTESVVVSILSAGTLIGALSGGPTADILGRRIGIMVSCVVFSLGVALQTGSSNLPTFIVGRFFAGVGVGLVSALVPMYQSECAPKWIRGAVVSCYSLAITVGLLLASVINNATKARGDHSAWRVPIAVQFVWATILFVGMLWLPETPRWLVKEDHQIAAAKALSRLTSRPPEDPSVQAELEDIRVALESEREMGESTYKDCFRLNQNKTGLRTISGIAILALQQLTGINFLFYYGTTFFAHVGIRNPFLVSVANTIVNMGMTLPGMWATDRLGRRPLLLGGGAVMSVCAYLIAILGVTASVEDIAPQRALIALMCIYIAAFASTWGPVGWVVVGETFPLNVRAKAMSLAIASHWLWNWAISFAAPYLVNSGQGNANLGVKVFFIWGSTCALGVLFAYLCIPETRGLALEQIDLLYQHSTPRTSRRFLQELGIRDRACMEPEGEAQEEKDGDPLDLSSVPTVGKTA